MGKHKIESNGQEVDIHENKICISSCLGKMSKAISKVKASLSNSPRNTNTVAKKKELDIRKKVE